VYEETTKHRLIRLHWISTVCLFRCGATNTLVEWNIFAAYFVCSLVALACNHLEAHRVEETQHKTVCSLSILYTNEGKRVLDNFPNEHSCPCFGDTVPFLEPDEMSIHSKI